MTSNKTPPLAGMGRGIAWALASQAGRQLATFATTILLARQLAPADFGLMGMAIVFTGLVAIVNDVGVSGALIQRQQVTQLHLSSMFWLNQVLGLALCLLTVVAAPQIAAFFDAPALIPLLRALSLGFVFGALGVVQQAVLVRAMDFRRVGIIETLAVVLAGAAAVTGAMLGLGVWSLVLQQLLTPALTSLGLWVSSTWRPNLLMDRRALAELVPFGANMAGFNVINYLSRNADYIIVGRFLGAGALGYYTLAYRLMVYPLQSVSSAVARVSFPAFSRAAGDPELLGESFLKMVKGVSLVTFPMVFGIFAIAPEFVEVAFGPQWAPTAPLLRILCVAGLVQSIGTTVGSVYQAIGRPGVQLRMGLLNTTLTIAALLTGLRWGLIGVATAYAVFAVVWVHFSLYVVTRMIKVSYARMYGRFAPAFLSSAVMVCGVFLTMRLLDGPSLAGLALQIVAGGVIQAVMLTVLGELRWKRGRPQLRL